MSDKPRYSRVSDIIDLAVFMQSKTQGITLSDIAERYNISRRTAIRMRDSLANIFPQIDEIETSDKQKHWGFVNYSIYNLINFTTEEIINIEQLQKTALNKEIKEKANKTIEKLKALSNREISLNEENIEQIMYSEGYAIRQTTQYNINPDFIKTIRKAIQKTKFITGTYHNKKRFLEPLGLIYGEKIYLVAKEKAKGEDVYNFALHKFENMGLSEKKFTKSDFNLKEYVNQSFGIYHDEILDVELKFSPKLAQEAKLYNFHPTQKIKENKDKTLSVKFKASGSIEICRHVFKWGAGCKIISPNSLKEKYEELLLENLKSCQETKTKKGKKGKKKGASNFKP